MFFVNLKISFNNNYNASLQLTKFLIYLKMASFQFRSENKLHSIQNSLWGEVYLCFYLKNLNTSLHYLSGRCCFEHCYYLSLLNVSFFIWLLKHVCFHLIFFRIWLCYVQALLFCCCSCICIYFLCFWLCTFLFEACLTCYMFSMC